MNNMYDLHDNKSLNCLFYSNTDNPNKRSLGGSKSFQGEKATGLQRRMNE